MWKTALIAAVVTLVVLNAIGSSPTLKKTLVPLAA
jgi:hypothetical protein